MPIYHNCIPYSDEYDRLKLGLPTSSHFSKLITPAGEPSKQWLGYAYHLIAERVLQRKVHTYTSPAMERGLIVESEAADWYEFAEDQTTGKIGFVTNDDGTIGCTPDRLVGDDGLLEIKCPLPPARVEYGVAPLLKWLAENRPGSLLKWPTGMNTRLERSYRPQLQGQLFICSDRAWVDIVCWSEDFRPPAIVVRVERDEKFQNTLGEILAEFLGHIETVMAKIGEVSAAPKAELRDMLRDALAAGK